MNAITTNLDVKDLFKKCFYASGTTVYRNGVLMTLITRDNYVDLYRVDMTLGDSTDKYRYHILSWKLDSTLIGVCDAMSLGERDFLNEIEKLVCRQGYCPVRYTICGE